MNSQAKGDTKEDNNPAVIIQDVSATKQQLDDVIGVRGPDYTALMSNQPQDSESLDFDCKPAQNHYLSLPIFHPHTLIL